MTEQNLTNSTDIFTCHSVPNKLNFLPPLTSSTTTLETDSITQSIVTIPTNEDHVSNDDVKQLETLSDINKCEFFNDSDNDSFDDEDETIISESLYPSLPPISSNYGTMSCPICFESAILQSSSCCKFRCCNSCWRSHISVAINDGRIKISCASNECDKYLVRETIVNFIRYDSILHERYLKLYANMNQNPRAKTCPRCSHLYSLDTIKPIVLKNKKKINKKIPKQVQCLECSLVWCFRCSAPWHENLTCKQFIKGDKLLLKWINQKNEDQWNARKCPNCSSVIQRAGGCPHMTCSSCSCEFCYLCGRRYIKIPIIGQHNNKFSMLGCPYNLHPEKPWLRRTIRGVIATGVIVASPLIVAGALTAAVTVLPTVGIYRLVKNVRSRRQANVGRMFIDNQEVLFGQDHEQQQPNEIFEFDLYGEDFNTQEVLRILRRLGEENNNQINDENINENFPLSIFADMDVENLFSEDDKPISDFRTCPTTPAINVRNNHNESLDYLITVNRFEC